MEHEIIKFKECNDYALRHFVKYGFLIFEGLFDEDILIKTHKFFFDRINHFKSLHLEQKIPSDVQAWSNAIIDDFSLTDTYDSLVTSIKIIDILKKILGPDIAILNYDHAWINFPNNNDPVLKKEIHTDAWTGTSINTLLTNIYITDVDDFNGLSVVPGSHIFGMTPVRNRKPDPNNGITYNLINLKQIKAGDFIIWHPLLLHSTTGNSDKNIRISISSRYTSTETPFSTQERALSYRTISVGPMNQISRLIGNDYLTPHRTLGGVVSVERRLRNLYNLCEYINESEFDYRKFLKDFE